MSSSKTSLPNPKRVAAGKGNWLKRKGLTAEGREKLGRAAHANQPWKFSTGPLTESGKAQSALNGKLRQTRPVSTRKLKTEIAGVSMLLKSLRELRALAGAD